MASVLVSDFTGLDLRKLDETATQKPRLVDTNNLWIVPGSSIASRPQVEHVCTLDSRSFGLYRVGDSLRAAMPRPDDVIPTAPPGFEYDVFGSGNEVSDDSAHLGTVSRVYSTVWQGQPYLSVGRIDPSLAGSTASVGLAWEHHLLPNSPTSPLSVTVTAGSTLMADALPANILVGSTLHFPQNIATSRVTALDPYRVTFPVTSTAAAGTDITLTMLTGTVSPALAYSVSYVERRGFDLTATTHPQVIISADYGNNPPRTSAQGTIGTSCTFTLYVQFSEAVTGFTSSDLTVTGTTQTVTFGTLADLGDNRYSIPCTVTLTSVPGDAATFTVNLPANAVTSAATLQKNTAYSVVIRNTMATGSRALLSVTWNSPTSGTLTVALDNPATATAWQLLTSTSATLGAVTNVAARLTATTPYTSFPSPVTINYVPQVDTRVRLPFLPGPWVKTVGGKVFATEYTTGNTWFSSTEFGPSDWTAPNDAGFLPTAAHAGGGANVTALGTFNGKLVVFYHESMQVWTVGPDPALHALASAIPSGGTAHGQALGGVYGDLFYFSQGGFRSASAVITTGQLKPGDVGAPIAPLTSAVKVADSLRGTWSEALSAYLVFDGTSGWVFSISPASNTADWTAWTLPVAPDYFAEIDGYLYFRVKGGNDVYRFNPAYAGESGYSWSGRLSFLDAAMQTAFSIRPGFSAAAKVKFWQAVLPAQHGAADWFVYPNTHDTTEREHLGYLDGSQVGGGIIAIGLAANRVAFGFEGTGYWTLDGFECEVKVGNRV